MKPRDEFTINAKIDSIERGRPKPVVDKPMTDSALERARMDLLFAIDLANERRLSPAMRKSDLDTAIARLEAAAQENAAVILLQSRLDEARLDGRLEQAERAVRLANAGRHSVEDLKEERDRLRREGEKG